MIEVPAEFLNALFMLLIVFAMRAFAQGWNVEQEVPIDEARRRGYNPPESSPPPQPATA